MSESGNMFEEFVKRFYIRYGKLLIDGFHNKNSLNNYSLIQTNSRMIKSVSPTKQRRNLINPQGLFNVNPRIKNTYGYGSTAITNNITD